MRVCARCKTEYADDVTICPADGSQTKPKTAQVAATDPLLGRMVGSYRLTKQLGKGGMGAVYMGEHPAIGSKVAVKFLHPQYAQVNEVVTRFFNEAKAVNLIKHDNIVQVVDYFYLDDVMPCFIMEFLDRGYAMTKLVGRPNPLQVTGPILIQVCDALQAAHDKRIIHRDLKPDNIFLAVRNYRKHFVKVMDFGIAKLAASGEGSDSNTQMGQVLGTPSYMSPEQASGKVDLIGPTSDIYSLGMIMYQLAVGRVPFRGALGEIIVAHMNTAPPPPREQIPDIPAAYEAIILKAIAKKPEERFGSMRELGQAIAATMRGLGLSLELPADDGESTGTDFAPSVSLSPYPTRDQAPSGTQAPAAAKVAVEDSGATSYPNRPSASTASASAPDSGATAYPSRPSASTASASPPEGGATTYPERTSPANLDSGATAYPNRGPSGSVASGAQAQGATSYPQSSSAPVAVSPAMAVPEADLSGPTMAPTRGAPGPTLAGPSALASPPIALSTPVAAPAAVSAREAMPAPRSSARWMVAGIAFVLGVATPIALVKGGVIGAHSVKK